MTDKQQPLPGGFEPDAARYRKASEPHESRQAAETAMSAFYDELSELRVKYRIRDMLIINSVCFLENEKEVVTFGRTGFGNPSLWESLAAFAYGVEKRSREEQISQLLTGKE